MNRTGFFFVFLLFLVFTGVFFFFSGCTGTTGNSQKQYVDQVATRMNQFLKQVGQAEDRIKKAVRRAEAAQRQTALTAERMKVMMDYLERKLKEIQNQYFELESLIVSTQSSIKKNSKR